MKEKFIPTQEELSLAKKEFEEENPTKSWDSLRAQCKNRLAKQQRFHKQYHDLCDAISTFRK